jgi:hypothetical protein
VTVRISLGAFTDRLDKLPADLEAACLRGLRSAAMRLEGMIPEAIQSTAPYPPNDTGELMRSHYSQPTPRGAVAGVSAPHAPFMEYGTRPHCPPEQPLAEWAYRKGLADSEEEAQQMARAICRKIAREGLAPRHFLARAVRMLMDRGIVEEELRRELHEVRP